MSSPVDNNRKAVFPNPLSRLFNIFRLRSNSSSMDRDGQSKESDDTGDKRNTDFRQHECIVSLPMPDTASGNFNEKFGETPGNTVQCSICLLEQPRECFPEISSCGHRSCYNCMKQYLKTEITESRVNICCPACIEPIHPNQIHWILNDETLSSKYESFMLRKVLVTEPDTRWCPAPDCGYAVIASDCAGCPMLKCERSGCNTFFCYHCKFEWHPNQTCDAARGVQKDAELEGAQSSLIEGTCEEDSIKPCPRCNVPIMKTEDGSCNHMKCVACGIEFCWLCKQEITDLHFLSPSGCTFWGKKIWSRKKKIKWHFGILIGAPVGIALIAAIAIPSIVIGIPVSVCRKLRAKYTRPETSWLKRNLIVFGGIVASALLSPIVAALSVVIGVPFLFGYTYCVVPFSLFRHYFGDVPASSADASDKTDEVHEEVNPMAANKHGNADLSDSSNGTEEVMEMEKQKGKSKKKKPRISTMHGDEA